MNRPFQIPLESESTDINEAFQDQSCFQPFLTENIFSNVINILPHKSLLAKWLSSSTSLNSSEAEVTLKRDLKNKNNNKKNTPTHTRFHLEQSQADINKIIIEKNPNKQTLQAWTLWKTYTGTDLLRHLPAHGQRQLQLQLLLPAGLGPRLLQLRGHSRGCGCWETKHTTFSTANSTNRARVGLLHPVFGLKAPSGSWGEVSAEGDRVRMGGHRIHRIAGLERTFQIIESVGVQGKTFEIKI